MSEHCAFGNTLDEMIRDRLVCGIRDARVQRRLLSEAELDLKKAFDLAQSSEIADKNAKDIQRQGASWGSNTKAPRDTNLALAVVVSIALSPVVSKMPSVMLVARQATCQKSVAASLDSKVVLNGTSLSGRKLEAQHTGLVRNGETRMRPTNSGF